MGQHLKQKVHYPEIVIFPDGERRIRIFEEVLGHEILILKSFGQPVDPGIPEFCFTLDCFKRNGAGNITGIIPYFPYSRADHMFRTGEGVALESVIKMFEGAGLGKVLLVDPHSIKTPEVFSIPVIAESGMDVFADEIKRLCANLQDVCLVSPDLGGIHRIQKISQLLNDMPFVTITKDRDLETGELGISGVDGEVKKIAMVVDDMVASGKTAANAAAKLKELGAETVYCFATHAVLTPEAPGILQNSEYEKVYVTDSLPVTKDKQFEKLKVLSIGELICHSIKSS